MDYRHEWKFAINGADRLVLRRRLGAVMAPDSHGTGGRYQVRSLYFDSPTDRALREKIDGADRREKFRIRLYDGDTSLIRLEKKSKQNGLSRKESALLTRAEAQALTAGDTAWMAGHPSALVRELCAKMRTQGLRPKTVVDYTREAFVFGPGNVRVTLDYDIRTGLRRTDFLDPDLVTIPAGDAPCILEVKWDAFLPDIVREAVTLPGRRAGAFSKYAQCRIYG